MTNEKNGEKLKSIIVLIISTTAIYFIMYMLRKPFTAATFEDIRFLGLDFKSSLVIAQIFGYSISKFLGINVISNLTKEKRLPFLIILLVTAFLSLVGFAFSPLKFGPFWLFVNGLPLGMVWGVVYQYIEGRRITEFLTVFIASNFIISSGIAKSWGVSLINSGVSEQMMPFKIALFCLPFIILLLWLLHITKDPDIEDHLQRNKRTPMNLSMKKDFLLKYKKYIISFVLLYIFLTIIRDIRDNFSVEIWTALVSGVNPKTYTLAELPVMFFTLFSIGFLYKINDNKKALLTMVKIMLSSVFILTVATILFHFTNFSPLAWMILSGMGLFIPYILMNGMVFDRFIANCRVNGNVGFIMYIADAFGYLSSVGIILYKNFGSANISWHHFYITVCVIGGSLSLFLIINLLRLIKQ